MKLRHVVILALSLIGHAALAAPATLTQAVTNGSEIITMQLTRQDLRGENFELWVQNASGGYDTNMVPVAERSYIGTVDEYPGAVSCGIQKDDGTFWGAVYFSRGESWYTLGGNVEWTRGLDADPSTFTGYSLPGASSVTAGQAGSTMFGYEVGVDVDYNYFSNMVTVAKTMEGIEYSVAVTRAIYMHDALLRPYLGRVIIRATLAHDPYTGTSAGGYLDAVRSEWNTNHTDTDPDVVAGVSPTKIGGGLAWVGVVGTSSGYSVNDATTDTGEFHIVWRHEMGHNWGCGHFVGGTPEGSGLMGGNAVGRFSGCEVYNVLAHRDSRPVGVLDDEGTYTAVDLPPYASLDSGRFVQSTGVSTTNDVTANDHDANGQAVSLSGFEGTSANGGTITQSGQDLVYTAHPAFLGDDYFHYTITNTAGLESMGVVVIDVQLDEMPGRIYTGSGTDYTGANAVGAAGAYIWGMDVDPINNVTNCDVDANSDKDFHELLSTPVDPSDGLASNTDGTLFRWDYAGSPSRANGLQNNNPYTFEMGLDIKGTGTEGVRGVFGLALRLTDSTSHGQLMLEIGRNGLHFEGGVDATNVLTTAAVTQNNEGYHTWRIAYDQDITELFIYRDGILLNKDGVGIPGAMDLGSPPNEWIGDYTSALSGDWELDYIVLDATGAYSPTLVNHAPVWKSNPVVDAGANTGSAYSSTLTDDVVDHDGDTLTFTKISGPAWLTVASDGTLSGTPAGSDFGLNSWTVEVSDGTAPAVQATLNIDVNITLFSEDFERTAGTTIGNGWIEEVNDSRIFDTAQPATKMLISVTAGTPFSVVNQLGTTYTNGTSYELTWKGSRAASANGTLLYDVSVGTWNGATFTPLATENGSIANVNLLGKIAGPAVSFKASATEAGQQIAIRLEVLSGSSDWAGFDDIAVNVVGENSSPTFTADPFSTTNATEDAAYSDTIAGSATDVDVGDTLTYSKVSGPAWLTVASAGTLSGTPVNGDVGLNAFTVQVDDGNGGTDSATLNITVINVNDAPTWNTSPVNEIGATEDAAYSSTLADDATDVDVGDTLTFTKVSGPAWLSVAANGALNGTPANGDVGPNSWTVDVSDGIAAPVQVTVNITVANVNDAPVFTADPFSTSDATEDAAYSDTIAGSATDVDVGDTLTYSKLSGPAWLSVATSGALSGTPANGDVGLNAFTVQADDGNGGTDTATLNITVINVNDAPVFTADPFSTTNATEDVVYSDMIDGSATDVDVGDTLTYSKLTGPAWLVVATNGTLSGTPGAVDVGLNVFTVQADDGNGGTDGATLNITVDAASSILLDDDFERTAGTTIGNGWIEEVNDSRIYDTAQSATKMVISVSAGVPFSIVNQLTSTYVEGDRYEVTWNASRATSASGTLVYDVSIGTWNGSVFTPLATQTGSIGNLNLFGKVAGPAVYTTATGSDAGQQIAVRFEVASGSSDWAGFDDIVVNNLGADPSDTTPPAAPAGLTALAGIGLVELDWADNAEPDLGGYTVYRSTTSGSGYAAVATGVATSDYTDGTAANHTTYYYVVTASDTNANESANSAEASAQPGWVSDSATSDIAVSGTVSGTLADAAVNDDAYQAITEVVSSNTSELEHKWVFDVTGAELVTFYVEAHHSANAEGDDFVFVYSTNDVDYVDMVTVTKTADDDTTQYHALPSGLGGTVYVRVRDADRTDGNTQLDTLSVDAMFIVSEESTAAPGIVSSPVPVDSATDVALDAQLSWTAGLMTVSHDVYFGTNPSPAFQGNQAGTTFDPGTLLNSATYYWAVDEVNNSGTTAGPVWSFTTVAAPNLPPTFTSDPFSKANATENSAYSGNIAGDASDPESDPMTFSKVSGPAWLSVASDGTLSGTPGAGDVGLNTFTVQVDATGGSDTATLNITVDEDSVPLPGAASSPSPVHRARNISTTPTLSWTAGSDAVSHNVYFGTSSANLVFHGNQAGTTFAPGTLSNKTTYYWRIDEVNSAGTTTGSAWQFKTVR